MLREKILGRTCDFCLDGRHFKCRDSSCVCRLCRGQNQQKYADKTRRKIKASIERKQREERAIKIASYGGSSLSKSRISYEEWVRRESRKALRQASKINDRDYRVVPPPMVRAIIKCYLVYGMSTREIARRSGLSRYKVTEVLAKEKLVNDKTILRGKK